MLNAADAVDQNLLTWNLLAGTATRYVLLAVNIGLGLFLMPFTVRHLGQTEYGLWMLVASLTYYFQLLDLGYGSSVVKQVTEADAQGDPQRVNRILSTFVIVYGAIGIAAAIGVLGLMLFIVPRFPNLQASEVRTAQLLLAIMGVRIAIGFPMAVFGAATNARQRFALNNTVAIVSALASGLATYVVLTSGGGLLTLVASTTALSIAAYGAYAWTAKIAFPEMSLRPSLFSRSIVREVTSFSVYFFLIDIAVQIGFNLDNIVIGGFIGTAAVTVYTVSLRLADYQRQLSNQFNGLLFPVVVRFGASGRRDALRSTLVEGTRIALLLVIAVTVCLVGFARPLIAAWMGPGFDQSVPTLYVLAFTGIVLVGQGPLGNVLLGTGRHRLVAFASLAESAANLALSLVLVRPLGIIGVAIGTAVPVVVVNWALLLPAACRSVDMSVWRFTWLVVGPALNGAVPASLVCMAFRMFLPPRSLAAVFVEGAFVGLVYVAAVFSTGLDRDVRLRYLIRLRELLPATRRSFALGPAKAPADHQTRRL